MARPEHPILTSNPHLEELAQWLRAQRRAAGVTHREMAEMSGHAFSATTFSRATDGKRIPRLRVVEAYARACRAPVKQAQRHWQAARTYAANQRTPARAEVPRLDHVYTRTQLNKALQHLYYTSGAMPVNEMERRAGAHGELPHSSVLRMLADQTMLEYAQLTAFLRVCGVTDGVEWERWRRAWQRAWKRQEMEKMGGRLARRHKSSTRSQRSTRDTNETAADVYSDFDRGPRFDFPLYVALAGRLPHSSDREPAAVAATDWV
ncbi:MULTISPECIES: helix-turn-helix transcriptional regulator [unclassified Streptomyces]|uniref:helix-turn-helix domain-containing protein n=1 Tax=unclassified Streptomyces TaxID=2593676 RepID=UPI001369C816|nr:MULTISPECIES: helix-turn-helix transcriptional regulator [unclassified Streptomyces]NEA03148.1 helix-turn-helix domain-containing protein [Streptomyces sp. SID10116]MYY81559.1 helix-turn-helix domain-containing protein [Streptomyces sp. SID335]MYZ12081.1 helix-turn-helix domain-containing protein [Streptomyces sp. SID337]MYZ15549.1 helix-turn-helix domain-containing protein [Streptomyces sp. SID337]NDZ86556.1 helix-turn-helix domain-containing protein [Streptomyces sp. SID10115]